MLCAEPNLRLINQSQRDRLSLQVNQHLQESKRQTVHEVTAQLEMCLLRQIAYNYVTFFKCKAFYTDLFIYS